MRKISRYLVLDMRETEELTTQELEACRSHLQQFTHISVIHPRAEIIQRYVALQGRNAFGIRAHAVRIWGKSLEHAYELAYQLLMLTR